jgi:hypothetical protein
MRKFALFLVVGISISFFGVAQTNISSPINVQEFSKKEGDTTYTNNTQLVPITNIKYREISKDLAPIADFKVRENINGLIPIADIKPNVLYNSFDKKKKQSNDTLK